MARKAPKFEAHPLTRDRWNDLVELFNRPGAAIARNCWCMYYRKTGPWVGPADANKKALKSLVNRAYVPGLIGYEDGRPVGWVSLSPRDDYERLRRSPVMKPVDDKPVWSIVCFFVDSKARGKGISEALLEAAVEYARTKGATLVEAYPVDKKEKVWTSWFGTKPMYDRAGFKEVARRTETRPVMRKGIGPRRKLGGR